MVNATSEKRVISLTKEEDYTTISSDDTILVDGSNNKVTITLPESPTLNKILNIKCINSTFKCDIDPNGKSIDGSSSNLVLARNVSRTIQYDSTFGWVILA